MPAVIIPGAIKRNVYLYSDDHTEKRDTQLPDVEWVNDEIAAEKAAREAADAVLQANIDAEETRAKAAEATLQANIDAEETRAETAEAALQTAITNEVSRAQAAEALKEDKANKVTSSATYVSDNTKYPTTAAVDARIAEISPTEVEYATQNVTTFAQIKQWLNAGKLVVAKCGDGENELYVTDIYDDSVFFCRVSGTYSERYIVDSNGWHLSSNSLEQTGNKLASTSTWTSDETKYPTTKAVENYVAAHAPSGVEWATYGTTTYNQIKSWNDAGKPVFLKYTVGGPVDYIMKLTIVTPGGAFFCGIQGISEYTAEVNPANQWSYNNSGLQASALVHEYETWDETDDTSYPSLASVSNYVASHAGGAEIFYATRGTTTMAQLIAAKNDGKLLRLWVNKNLGKSIPCSAFVDYEDGTCYAAFSGTIDDFICYTYLFTTGVWDSFNYRFPEDQDNKLISAYAWTSDDYHYPSTQAVENYVASHAGSDIYDIAIPGMIPVTCDSCFYNDNSNTWEVKFSGSGTMYSPRINFKLLKNGNELQLDSNVKIVAEPYVSSGTKTYSSGQYFNAPSAPNWGTMSQDSYPAVSSGKYFGIKIMQSAATTSPDNSYIYIKYNGGTSVSGSSGLDPSKCYFVLSLYDKRVSQTVPVTRKVIQITPTLMANGSLELQSNKLLSTSTWTSNDTKYPTSQAIANYVSANAGPIKIATTSNTSSQIYAWQQAGNAVFLKDSGDLYALQYCNNTTAYFVQLYVPDANTDPQVYWKVANGTTWTGGNFYLQKKGGASDVYTIEGDGTIFFPVSSMTWDGTNQRWRLTYYPATSSTSSIYCARTNFRMLKNGEAFAFNSNYWLNIKPWTTDGTQTWAAGSNILVPTTTWGDTTATETPTGTKIAAGFSLSSGTTVAAHTSYITLFGKMLANTAVSSWDPADNFFWLELYDKNVSQTVPVCRKLMRFAPTVISNYNMTGQTFAWISACKNVCPDLLYIKALNSQWYDGTVLRYTNTNAAGNCHYFEGLAYNSTDGKYYIIRWSKQESTASYSAAKITTT